MGILQRPSLPNMSAFGPKRTSVVALQESAFGGKADMTIGDSAKVKR